MYWGNLFPWRFEERVQSAFAYPDQVISGFYEKLKKEHLESYTLIPAPQRLSFLLSVKAFQHLRKNPRNVDLLDVANPAARQLMLEMIEDILHITDFAGLFFESEGIQESDSVPEEEGFSTSKEITHAYYYHLIESSLLAGGKVLWQVSGPTSEDTMKVFGEKIERVSFKPVGSSWTLSPINGKTPVDLPLSKGIIFIPNRHDTGFNVPLPLNRNSLDLLVTAAAWAWNGRLGFDNRGAEKDLSSMFLIPGIENHQRNEFICLLDETYRLSRELKEQHTTLLTLQDTHNIGDSYTWNLVSRAAKMDQEIRKVCGKNYFQDERMVDPQWIDRWVTLKMLPALEDLTTAAVRLRSLLELCSSEPEENLI
ncbi:MAG: hypothetical protein JW760_06690 [Spirochaetales bacterium]|nr:hypothetical protein [Spirochaetales bacterium]